jgi:hypothetical protein
MSHVVAGPSEWLGLKYRPLTISPKTREDLEVFSLNVAWRNIDCMHQGHMHRAHTMFTFKCIVSHIFGKNGKTFSWLNHSPIVELNWVARAILFLKM